ncbi:MAG: UDP-glucose--hexose-1-phosphate uridylyltransferase [Bacilli bacterium]|nr:UDP-glucose--hexose-1-phosphate uridylyltransferase [Bacilli bacterium]
MVNVFENIEALIHYGLETKLISKQDEIYVRNRFFALFNINQQEHEGIKTFPLEIILENLVSYALENHLVEDSLSSKEIFIDELMNILLDRPSNIIRNFKNLYREDSRLATEYFYELNIASNYIKSYRIKNDVKWTTKTEFGELDITINLSKPEKDPKDIITAKSAPVSSYPACLLCKENEGYKGHVNHPSRANIRLIPIKLGNEQYYFQYSPYSYYNEHCIVLSDNHIPMRMDKSIIEQLLDFVSKFPHYFLGSNAGLPVVGGSILSHEHFQGGRYHFPMEDAEVIHTFVLKDFDLEASILKWPLSVIRISSKDKNKLIDAASYILDKWRMYEDKEVPIIPYTGETSHNTYTPIARINKENEYELDLVLRNNLTSEEFPLGIFHTHPEFHHIKKENIGLIEVMGLAILPSRLKQEMEYMKQYLLEEPLDLSLISSHKPWLDSLKIKHKFNKNNVDLLLKQEIGLTFAELLKDSGVFKPTEEGLIFFKRFVDFLNK